MRRFGELVAKIELCRDSDYDGMLLEVGMANARVYWQRRVWCSYSLWRGAGRKSTIPNYQNFIGHCIKIDDTISDGFWDEALDHVKAWNRWLDVNGFSEREVEVKLRDRFTREATNTILAKGDNLTDALMLGIMGEMKRSAYAEKLIDDSKEESD